jgi:hypothetical protein
MNMNKIKSFALSALLFFCAQALMAQSKGGQRRVEMDSLMNIIQLSAQQKAQVKEIRLKHKSQLQAARSNTDKAARHSAMKQEMSAMNQEIRQLLDERQRGHWDAYWQGKRK